MENKFQPLATVTLQDGVEMAVESFVIEQSWDRTLLAQGVEQTEDERIAAPLDKVKRIWHGSPEPHLVIPETLPESGLPDHVVTAWCRVGEEQDELVLVFFANVDDSQLSIKEIFQMHLEGIHADFLVGVDQAEERKIFDWFNRI